jgi:hypothetical protein
MKRLVAGAGQTIFPRMNLRRQDLRHHHRRATIHQAPLLVRNQVQEQGRGRDAHTGRLDNAESALRRSNQLSTLLQTVFQDSCSHQEWYIKTKTAA